MLQKAKNRKGKGILHLKLDFALEHLKLQTCIMKQTHHKNVEIFPCK
jgi:hypothetical protein